MKRRGRFSLPIVCSLLVAVVMSVGEAFAEQTDAPIDRKVLAFYYTWYGSPEVSGKWLHWRRGESDFSLLDQRGLPYVRSTNHPTIGLYDSNDPLVISGHLKLARNAGIDAFIATWWGQNDFTDKAFEACMDVADKMKSTTKLTIYYETVPNEDPQKAVEDLLYVLEKYGGRESFLKVNGVPVVFIYGRAMGQLSAAQWGEVVAAVKKEKPAAFIADTDGRTKANRADFDGFHFYNPVGRVKRGTNMGTFYRKYVEKLRAPGKTVCLTIIPGYDDTHVRQPGTAVSRENTALYSRLWSSAVAARPDWILITSWNEWHEGSEIEPSVEDGRVYLDMTAEQAPAFKNATGR